MVMKALQRMIEVRVDVMMEKGNVWMENRMRVSRLWMDALGLWMGSGLGEVLVMMGGPVLDILISEMYTKDKGKKNSQRPFQRQYSLSST